MLFSSISKLFNKISISGKSDVSKYSPFCSLTINELKLLFIELVEIFLRIVYSISGGDSCEHIR